jgi:hypothetical protein
MNNTQFTDAQIAAFILAAEAMQENYMDYWPLDLLGLPSEFSLYSMEDDSIWLVNTNNSGSMRDATKIQMILGSASFGSA